MIIENDLTSVEQVTNYVKAGGGCGSCLAGIEDLLLDVQQEKAALTERVAAEVASTSTPLTPIQKINLIQQVLTEDVRPILLADGGDIELYDVSGDVVTVSLKGACGGCASSHDTLKNSIETQLRSRISPTLTVVEA